MFHISKTSPPTEKRFFGIIVLFIILFFTSSPQYAEGNAIETMLQTTTSYFRPVKGQIVFNAGKQVVVNIGSKDFVTLGMRLHVLREDAPFRHPVTKEPLGRLESLVGKLQIREVRNDTSLADILEGDVKEGDTVRISELKISLLFCQSRDTDWQLAEHYYRKLKESGRFQMIDTALETNNPEEILEEARRVRADVALHLSTKRTEKDAFLAQELYWASDGQKIGSMEVKIDQNLVRELSLGEKFFPLEKHEPLIRFDVPTAAKLMMICDVDGDGKKELLFSTGSDLIVYSLDKDLHPALGGISIKGTKHDNHIWIDAIDLNKNGRDEIIVTSLKGSAVISDYEQSTKTDDIVSSLYEHDGKEFTLLYQGNGFMRKIGQKLYMQPYTRSLGFEGEVSELFWDQVVKKGDALKLPAGVNIYDFILLEDLQSESLLLAYDENGYLTLYDRNGLSLWRSKTSIGAFLTTFKKSAPSVMVDRGTWSVKDRLLFRQKEILYIKRIPFLDIVKGFGYKKSEIRSLRWDGYTMEERTVVDGVNGTILDYAVTNDNIFILASPVFGIRAGNILKGDNPIRTELLVYPLQGI